MTTGSALRPAAMLLFSLAACNSDPVDSVSRPPACNLDDQQTQLADVVTTGIGELDGVVRTQTMVAFEAFSRHDLETMFSIGE